MDFLAIISWTAAIYSAAICLPSSVESSNFALLEQESRSAYVGYNSSSGLSVILSAPHGGEIYPDEIPDRDAGCWDSSAKRCTWTHNCGVKNISKCKAVTVSDNFTQEMTGELRARLCELFLGLCPAAVVNRLGRAKFDANRDRDEATFGIPEVVQAFDDYHAVIEKEIAAMGGVGLFIDIHGHGHKMQRAELGYLVRGDALDVGDPIDPNVTSIRALAHSVRLDFDELLRGKNSFGGILGGLGFDGVPSPKYRGPGHLVYFSGGYNTRRHGSVSRGSFDAVQIESARSHRAPDVRPRYVKALACTIKRYYCAYYKRVRASSRGVNSVAVRFQSLSERLTNACEAYPNDTCRTSRVHVGFHL